MNLGRYNEPKSIFSKLSKKQGENLKKFTRLLQKLGEGPLIQLSEGSLKKKTWYPG